MISFFRKFRQNLLEQNRVTRYLAYAIGEIVLVVIGIMIALYFNTQKQLREAHEFELTMLQEVYNTIEDNEQLFRMQLHRLEETDTAIHQFLEELEKPDPIEDSLYHYFDDIRASRFTYNRGSYDALKSVGLDKVSSDSLRGRLTSFFDGNILRTEELIMLVYERPMDEAQRRTDKLYQGHVKKEPGGLTYMERVLKPGIDWKDPEILNAVSLRSQAGRSAIARVNRLINESKSLKEILEIELGIPKSTEE